MQERVGACETDIYMCNVSAALALLAYGVERATLVRCKGIWAGVPRRTNPRWTLGRLLSATFGPARAAVAHVKREHPHWLGDAKRASGEPVERGSRKAASLRSSKNWRTVYELGAWIP
jgi:hypothetical protein